ncbi:unnamed protein product [Pylaiella littoralis]
MKVTKLNSFHADVFMSGSDILRFGVIHGQASAGFARLDPGPMLARGRPRRRRCRHRHRRMQARPGTPRGVFKTKLAN